MKPRVAVTIRTHRADACCWRCTKAGRDGLDAADWHHDWQTAAVVLAGLWGAAAVVILNVILVGS